MDENHRAKDLPALPPALLGMDRAELSSVAARLGEPGFRGAQLEAWLYRKGATGFDAMSDLPGRFRERLAETWRIGRDAPIRVDVSRDGTRKYLFREGDGRFIEAAYIPEPGRATLCLSTQVGCRMGCAFCATGRQGFQGNLDAGRIVNQYLSLPERAEVSNIVYMGMGEPLDNPDATFRSIELFTDPAAIGLGPRKITLSTAGVLPALREFLERTEVHLALSLHSPFDDERFSLMPVQNAHPVAEILSLLRARDWSGQRRLSFEYIMFAGLNDDLRHARELVRLLSGIRCRVNLIRWHAVPGAAYQGSGSAAMEAFQGLLKDKGIITTIRRSRGLDIRAACGLLSTGEIARRHEGLA